MNQRKYKLIKSYPGSPDLGTIVKEHVFSENYKCYKIIDTVARPEINQSTIENSPEFWKEIIEKDYEILSFSRDKSIYTVRENGRLLIDEEMYKGMNADPNATHWEDATEKGFSIHSVKRLSDGEVFTIGDKVNMNNAPSNCTLKGIELDNNYYGGLYFYNVIGGIGLYKITKAKQPIFTTEDGVDIYEGYGYSKVSNSLKVTCNIAKKTWRGNASSCTSKYFSTRELAEEYVLMNKPCLSINDILNKGLAVYTFDSNATLKTLKELVKSKL